MSFSRPFFLRVHPDLRERTGIFRKIGPYSFAIREQHRKFHLRDVKNISAQASFLRPCWIGFVVLCGLAAFLTFTGVYDAVRGLPFWLGWGYWMLTLSVGCLVGYGVIVISGRFGAPYILQYGAAILASTAAVTSVIAGLQIMVGQPVPWSFIPYLFGQVLVISILVYCLGLISERAKNTAASETPSRDPIKHFLEQLPMKYRETELYAISSEDHYLRVHTSKGEELILKRLSDAVHDLKDADGLQTHRSWWVAAGGVEKVIKDNGQTKLMLKSGSLAPVSRTYQSAVKAAGWF